MRNTPSITLWSHLSELFSVHAIQQVNCTPLNISLGRDSTENLTKGLFHKKEQSPETSEWLQKAPGGGSGGSGHDKGEKAG